MVEDFLYICDDAYKRRDFLAMERSILKEIGLIMFYIYTGTLSPSG